MEVHTNERARATRNGAPTSTGSHQDKCPVQHTLELLGGKWKLQIIYVLYKGSPIRFKQLEREIVGITPTMLSAQLKDLEANGLVKREAFATIPPTVEYSLTALGETLVPLILEIKRWGTAHLEKIGR